MAMLPTEFIRPIAIYLPIDQLAVFALANHAFRLEAERLIYRNIKLYASDPSESVKKCLDTLIASPEKACLVHSFAFVFKSQHEGHERLETQLCDVLPMLTCLKHLDIRALASQYSPKNIEAALRHSTFKLSTFRFSKGLHLFNWVLEQQTSLTSLAIDGIGKYISRDELAICRALLTPSHPNMTLCCHDRDGALFTNLMIVFPAFAPAVDGITTWSADPIKDHFTSLGPPSVINDFYVYLSSLSDEETLVRSLTSIADNFTMIDHLVIRVENVRIHIYPKVFSSLLSRFRKLRSLYIQFWNEAGDTAGPYQDRMSLLASTWAEKSQTLFVVGFPNNVEMVCEEAASGEWVQFVPT